MIQWVINEVTEVSPSDLVLGLSYWALKWSAYLCALSVLLLGCFLAVARCMQRKSLKQLEHLPGSREMLPFLNDYIMFKACSQPDNPAGFGALVLSTLSGLHACFQKYGMHRNYSGLTPIVIIYRADFVEELLRSNKVLTKGGEYNLLHSWLGTGLLTSTGNKWRSRRRLFTPAFHFRILEDFSSAINSHSMVLADILGKKSLDHNGVDVVPKVTLCTLDIVCETIMGKVLNAQSNEDLAYVKALLRLSELFLERTMNPLAAFESIYRLTAKGKEYNHCLDTLHAFTRQVIAERKNDMKATIDIGSLLRTEDDSSSNFTKQKRPFLDLLLLEHFKDGKNITEEDIREEVDTFMFEGHDTTAVGISWALFLIGLSPVEQQKIHDELDFIFGDDTERHVTIEDMKEMRYLECVIKESQRLYPSVPFYSRLCEEPFELGGTMLPKGTVVQVSNYFLHRDPKVFPKPEEFRPDRFLPENSKGRHPFAYVPFSAGSRNCIGQKFAMSEEKIVIANILRRFKLQSLDQRDQVGLIADMVLRPKGGIRIKFIPRTSSKGA
ncbi:cytochrome P450 4c3 [Ixodes scapularis]|uniref:cytochrome P450 4c3 n=1 Tax=Ixodes scapularis TaxID=6945 RepID=UPI001A9EA7BF|nr:cytochrome P450 4c3 [Ixodes scapularis]